GTSILAAPVSGNPKVVKSGKLTSVVSGPEEAWKTARPYIELFGRKATYVGEGDTARLVKICHNLMLGVVTQSMAEITLLAEAAGVSRYDFLDSSTTQSWGPPSPATRLRHSSTSTTSPPSPG